MYRELSYFCHGGTGNGQSTSEERLTLGFDEYSCTIQVSQEDRSKSVLASSGNVRQFRLYQWL
jgi:hypothetical protein